MQKVPRPTPDVLAQSLLTAPQPQAVNGQSRNPMPLYDEDAMYDQGDQTADLTKTQVERAKRRRTGGLRDLKVWQKLGLIAVVLFIPSAVLLYEVISDAQAEVSLITAEQRGVDYLRTIEGLLLEVPRYSGATMLVKSGDVSQTQAQAQAAANIDRIIEDLADLDSRFGARYGLDDSYAQLQQSWQQLKTATASLSPAEFEARTDDFFENNLITFAHEIGTGTSLSFTGDPASSFASDITVRQNPELFHELNSMITRPSVVVLSNDQQVISAYRESIVGDIEVADLVDRQIIEDVEFLVERLPEVKALLEPLEEEADLRLNELVDTIERGVLADGAPTVNLSQVVGQALAAVESRVEVYEETLNVLNDRLSEKKSELQRTEVLNIGGLSIVLVFALALLVFIARLITRPLGQLQEVSEKVGQGDLSQLANIQSRDEIGKLASTFNTTILQLRAAAERNELELERSRQLQENVSGFLDVAMDIADGDFTKRGAVSEDVLGNIIDAINLMVEEVGALLGDVQKATSEVTSGSDEMIQTTEAIVSSTELQANEALKARHDVQNVTMSIREMAEQANASAAAAERTLQASQQGQEAVSSTLDGMQSIRREVQAIAKRIKGLGDRSLEISEIVDTISAISRQTNLLALNAAIEASGAGEAGSRFAIVADEVRKLAEGSAQATERIATLIQSVQAEVQEVIAGVEDGTREVETGYRVATEAGSRLQEIAEISQQSAQYARLISEATQTQVQGVEQVGSVVEQITQISESSKESVLEGKKVAEQLQTLAQQLSENLTRFRLA